MSKEFNYNQVTTEEGNYWCLQTVADYLEVSYDTVYYHAIRTNKEEIFTPFIRSFEVVSNNGKKRDQLFLKVPEAVMELSQCIPSLRFNTVMNDIMKLSLDVQQGDLKAISKEGVNKLKESYNELVSKYNAKRQENVNLLLELTNVKIENLNFSGSKYEIKKLKRQLKEKDQEIESLTHQLDETQQQIWSITRRFDTNKEIVSLRKKLREKETTITALKDQLIQVREYYKEKLRVMEGKLQGKKTVKNPSLLHFT